MNIGEAFLQDPEEREFEGRDAGGPGSSGISRLVWMPLRFAKPSTYHLAADAKTSFVQQGRMQQMRDGAGLGHGLIQKL